MATLVAYCRRMSSDRRPKLSFFGPITLLACFLLIGHSETISAYHVQDSDSHCPPNTLGGGQKTYGDNKQLA